MAPPIALSRVLGRRASSSSSSSSSASTSRIRAQGPPPPPSLPSSTPPSPPPDSPSAFIVQPTKEKKRIVVTETPSPSLPSSTQESKPRQELNPIPKSLTSSTPSPSTPLIPPKPRRASSKNVVPSKAQPRPRPPSTPVKRPVPNFLAAPVLQRQRLSIDPTPQKQPPSDIASLAEKRQKVELLSFLFSPPSTRLDSEVDVPDTKPIPPPTSQIERIPSPLPAAARPPPPPPPQPVPSTPSMLFASPPSEIKAPPPPRPPPPPSPRPHERKTNQDSSNAVVHRKSALRPVPSFILQQSKPKPTTSTVRTPSPPLNLPPKPVEQPRQEVRPEVVTQRTLSPPRSKSPPRPSFLTSTPTFSPPPPPSLPPRVSKPPLAQARPTVAVPPIVQRDLPPCPSFLLEVSTPGRTTVSSSSFKPSPSYSISSPPPLPRIVQAKVDGELNAKSTPPPPSPSPRVDVFRPPPSRQGPPIRPPPPYLTPMPRHTTAPRTRLPISPPRPSLRPSRVDANTSVPSFLLRGPSPNKLEDEDEHWTLETVGSTPDFDPPSFNLDNVAQIPPPISQLSPFKAPSNPTVSTSFYAWTPSEDPTLISSQKYVNWSPSELPLLQTYVSLPTPPFSFDDLASIPFSHISEGEFFAIRSFILDNGDPSVVGREDWAFWKANEDEKTALLEMVSREKWAFPPASDWELTQARRGWFDSMRWSEKGQEQWNRMLVLARFRQNVEKQGSQSTPSESVAYWKDSEVLALRTDLQSHGFQAVVTKHVSDLLPFDPHHSDLEWFMLEARFKNAFEASFRPSSSILSESEKVRLLRVAKVLGEASSWSGGKRRIWRMGDQARRAWGQMSSFASLGEDLERSRMEKRLARKQKRRLERTAEKTASKQSYQDLTTPFTSSGPSSSRSPADIPPPFDSQPGMKSPFSNLSFHDYRRALPRLVRPSHRSDVRPKMPIASPLRRPPSFLTAAPPRHIPNRSIPPPESILSNNPFRTGRVQTRLLPPPPPPRPLRQASGSTRSPFSTKHSLANHPPPSPKTKRTFPFSFFDQHTRLESPFSHYNSLATSPPPPVSSSRRSPAIKNTTRFKSPLVHRPKPSPHNSNSNRVPLPLPSRTSTVYPPFPPKASLLIYNHLIAIRSSRSGLPIPTRPVPTSTRFLLPEHPTFLLDLQTETEAYWSFHAQKDGIFLDPKRKDMYLEYLRSTARRAGSKERIGTTSLRQEANASFAVLGWTPEERFRVYCSWGKGKRWLEEVIARKKAKQGAVVVEEEKVGEESVSVNEEEVASTRVKFLAAREEVRNEEPMAGFSARFLAAREEARLVEEEEREEREREREREKDEKEEALAAERRNRRSFRSGSGS